MSTKKRIDLSVKQKLEIIEKYDKLPKMGQRNAAAQLRISQPLLCKILKSRDEIKHALITNANVEKKRNRTGKEPQVEAALKGWFTKVRNKDAKINGSLLRQKAEMLAQKMGKEGFVASEGWMNRWAKRENISFKRSHGEQKDADANAWIKDEWPKIIEKYDPSQIYNAAETGIYFKALPEHTFMFKNEFIKGCKVAKDRLTVLCAVNMAGKREKLLVIGKSRNPRCFKGVRTLPVQYKANENAWMTSSIFGEWLTNWDKKLTHNIVLLVDNCTAHSVNLTLKNIKLVLLPPNTSSLIQPCDQGVIRTFKAYYRHEMRSKILETMEENEDEENGLTADGLAEKTNVLEALHLLNKSWDKVTVERIKNCFRHGGFTAASDGNEENAGAEDNLRPIDLTQQEYDDWMNIDSGLEVSQPNTEDEICAAIMTANVEVKIEELPQNSDEDDEEEIKCPTNKEIRNAWDVLRKGVIYKGDEEDFQKFTEYENFINKFLTCDKPSTLD